MVCHFLPADIIVHNLALFLLIVVGMNPRSYSSLASALIALAVSATGCANLLGIRTPPSYADQVAGPERCFRSYLLSPTGGPRALNPNAAPSVAKWYATLTPADVLAMATDATRQTFQDRAMKSALAAGVPEGDLLRGEHPDPSRPCGVLWNVEDVGDYRFQNAASVAESVVRRDAFATCAKEFDELAPRLSALAQRTKKALADLGPTANPYDVWLTYHRVIAAQNDLLPIKEGAAPPVFAYAGAPYIAFTDMITRFAGSPFSFLAYHSLAGVSPFIDNAERFIQPLEAPNDDDKLLYCAQKLRNQGMVYSDFSDEDITKIFKPFDGEAWLDSQPTQGESYKRGTVHIDANDLRADVMIDHAMGGKSGADEEKFRLIQRKITATALREGKGTVELTNVTKAHVPYDCKRVAKITTDKKAQTATVEHLDVCKFDDNVRTDKLTLTVDELPKGVGLNTGDEIMFFAERTSNEVKDSGKPTATGRASTRNITQTAKLLFIAQIRRGGVVVFPTTK